MRILLIFLLLSFSIVASSQQYFLFIGSYTASGSKGIYVYRFDASTGKTQWLSNTESIVNPSYLAIAPGGKFLYACIETRTANRGGITAFRFNRSNASLTFINIQSSGGDNPAYVAVHKTGKWVVAGNYSGGNVSAFKVGVDGSLQAFSQLIQHTGNSINKQRQDKPHVHATVFSPKGDQLLVPDLGLDKIMIYNFNPAEPSPLTAALPAYVAATPGSGPRHFVFHPNKKYAYSIEEMAGAVSAYRYKNRKLQQLQRIAAHPDSIREGYGSADIHVSPDGKFLYASNRGKENNIAIFSIARNGALSLVGYQSTMGIKPRNFTIDPSGKYLLVANQQTNNIVIFKRNKKTGLLYYTGEQINIPEPVCLKMIE